MNTNKLKAKDLITTAIFSVVMIPVFFVGSMTFNMIPILYPFLVSAVCMTTEWTETFLIFTTWPVMLGSGVLAILGAVIGMLLGKAMLKKHFIKAGIV